MSLTLDTGVLLTLDTDVLVAPKIESEEEGEVVELDKSHHDIEEDGPKLKGHRYSYLKVNEVSIVTDPAILSEKEADQGVGFPIIKLNEAQELASTDSGEEDVAQTKGIDFEALVSEAKLNLAVALADGSAYHLYPVKVFSDYIIMTDPYKNPLDNDSIFFKIAFSVNEDGSFTFGNPIKLQLVFEEDGVKSTKLTCTRKEIQMTELKGVEIGGQVLKMNPMPGLEFSDDSGDLIFRCDEDGILHTGEGYVVHDDGIVRQETVAEKSEEPIEVQDVPDATEESTAQKFFFTVEQLKELMGSSGQSFKFRVLEDGQLELAALEPLHPKLTVPMPEDIDSTKSVEAEPVVTDSVAAPVEKSALELRMETLEAELTKAKQQIAGSSTTDPEIGAAAAKVMGISNYPHEAPIVPVGGDNLAGVFTRHIDKRLLDRRSRLQADLISG